RPIASACIAFLQNKPARHYEKQRTYNHLHSPISLYPQCESAFLRPLIAWHRSAEPSRLRFARTTDNQVPHTALSTPRAEPSGVPWSRASQRECLRHLFRTPGKENVVHPEEIPARYGWSHHRLCKLR